MSDIGYSEKDFENYIVNLLTSKSGYIHGNNNDYNPQKSILAQNFISFIKSTQPDSWTCLCDKFDTEQEAEEKLIDELIASRKSQGTLDLLRKGFTFRSIQFDTVYWKPENNLNPETIDLYNKNIFTVINQLIGDAGKSVHTPIPDIVLFINGIPVVTAELKFELQGQGYSEAETQYKLRSLAEPLFKFKTGPLVHFAVDTANASMTTKLSGFGTNFLPFNLGSNGAGNQGGKGNPKAAEGHFATDYLWEEVLSKDSLLDILQSFVTIEVEPKTKDETLIFPRYHQLDVVRKLLKDVEVNGSKKNYLIEHSAGSGKSNTIAWLAFHLNNLYFAGKNEKVFDTIIVLNDRRVLDKQTRNTIMSFNPKDGTVKIAKKSSDITDFIKLGNVIIISTIQKFPLIYKELEELKAQNPNRRFAVIADEAHQSQTGTAAGKVKIGLGSDAESQIKAEDQDDIPEEGDATDEEQEKILRQVATGKQSNMSFFAFTATPTGQTLQMFGVPCKVIDPKSGKEVDGYRPFHVYSMQQAIEEKYILDVLVNYSTYKQYYNLRIKNEDDDNQYDSKTIYGMAAKYVAEHEHRISKITDIIIEHFEQTGCKTIDGKGKAMVVTSSRKEAVLYARTLRDKLSQKSHSNWGVLVAFSGDIDGKTESQMNSFPINPLAEDGDIITENQTPEAFKQDKYRFIVVADKYQTGFSEKLLSVMYIDKPLHNIKAVQTLSRLNRTMANEAKLAERDCFILDFVNDREEIKEAFQTYYGKIELEGEYTIEELKALKAKIDKYAIIEETEVEQYIQILNELVAKNADLTKDNIAQKTMNLVSDFVARFKKLKDEDKKEFKHKCIRYVKIFMFLQNIQNIKDAPLVKLGLYLRLINPLLRIKYINPPEVIKPSDIKRLIELSDYKIDFEMTEAIRLVADDGSIVQPSPDGGAKDPPKPAPTTVQEMVSRINTRFGTDFTDEDIVPALSAFKKSFAADKEFCNTGLLKQYPKYELKYNGNDGLTVFVNTALSSPEITDKVRDVLTSNEEFLYSFKDEIRMPIYEHLIHKLHIA